MIDTPSIFKLIRKTAALVRPRPTKSCDGSGTGHDHVVEAELTRVSSSFVYYETLKRELKTKPIYEFRCDERLKTKVEESTRLSCTLYLKVWFGLL